jgi:aminoglycoside phosphotransferase family enzyme/predicted kinase
MSEGKLIKALLDVNTYPKGEVLGESVRMLQTHISWVFLTGKFVYKVKKPVNFGFLDFTSLDKRKYYCEEELALNKRFSDELYESVVPITEDDQGRIKINGKGKVIEYAVKMKELPQDSIMRKKLTQNKITYSIIDKLALEIACFHESLPINQEKAQIYGSLSNIKYNWDEHFLQTQSFIGRFLSKEKFDFIKHTAYEFIEKKEEIFNSRLKENKIKHCHGDLHSGNIFIYQDKIYLFDCIEFNPRFAYSDTCNDIAFLVMDLEFYNCKYLSEFFISKYLTYTKDYSLLKVLDFYKCYRAYVKGKVLGFQIEKEADKSLIEESCKYFDLAYLYAKSLSLPLRLIVFMGLPGVGKTYLAYKLAERLNLAWFNTDLVRKDIVGMYPEEDASSEFKKGIYTKEMTERVYQELFNRAISYLNQGKSCIIDGSFITPYLRKELLKFVKENNLWDISYAVWCECPEDVILARIRQRKRNSFLHSEATIDIYQKLKQEAKEPVYEELAPIKLIKLDTTLNIEVLIDALLRRIYT